MGKICAFFGHRDCPHSIKSKLRDTLINLIEDHAVDMFYVGNQGAFDAMAHIVLQELSTKYPHINYAVVLYRLPPSPTSLYPTDCIDTMLPEGIESVPPRFAIAWRNNWMLRQADFVVTYITHTWGGAAKFANKAVHQRKTVINLSQNCKGDADEIVT